MSKLSKQKIPKLTFRPLVFLHGLQPNHKHQNEQVESFLGVIAGDLQQVGAVELFEDGALDLYEVVGDQNDIECLAVRIYGDVHGDYLKYIFFQFNILVFKITI